MNLNSKLYVGEVGHSRLEPVKHLFCYPVYFYCFNLEELPKIEGQLHGFFGYNRIRPISIHDKDYLFGASGSLFDRLQFYLQGEGVHDVTQAELITGARFFNYVFNPVSFFYGYRADKTLRAIVVEINNTFGETHLYILKDLQSSLKNPESAADAKFIGKAVVAKSFHVSPFNDMKGDYDFLFSPLGEAMEIRINIVKDGKPVFISFMKGLSLPLTTTNLLLTIFKFPLNALLTMPRILWEATKLHYGKKLKVIAKPVPQSEFTIRMRPPSLLQRISSAVALKYFSRVRVGCLDVTFPDGSQRVFGDHKSEVRAAIVIRDPEFYWRCIKSGDIGFGESFTEGEWTSQDLTGLLRLLLLNENHSDDRRLLSTHIGRLIHRFQHRRRANTPHGSEKNIQFHYDLSNEFFEIFLDPTMMYSCPIFESENQSLEAAQLHRLKRIIQKLDLKPTDHLLEIGSGWGTMAIEAARISGCKVTSLTVSKRQLEYAEEKVKLAGLEDRVEIRFCDYRNVHGQFDKIVSIEMLEAVGEENLPIFFRKCDEVLKGGGLALIQVITLPEQRFESYRIGCDWIQKHIFPGSFIPSLSALVAAAKVSSSFEFEAIENIGSHYSRTLREWRSKLDANIDRIQELGFNEHFCRAWHYYMSYCEAGFGARAINDLQIVLKRPGV